MSKGPPQQFVDEINQFARSDAVDFLIASLIERYQEQWRTSAPENTTAREDAYRMVRALGDLKTEIRRVDRDDAVDAFNRGLRRTQNWSII
jgi:hypothetical protein